MAIVTDTYDLKALGLPNFRRPMAFSEFKGRSIAKRAFKTLPGPTGLQNALRLVGHFAAPKQANYTWSERQAWSYAYADWGVGAMRASTIQAQQRWLQLYAPSRYPDQDFDPSTLTIAAFTVAPMPSAIVVKLTPSSAYLLYGLILLQSTSPIETPTPEMAVAFLHHRTTATATYVTTQLPRRPHYFRACAFTIGGRRGVFCDQLSATPR
jgi:hypothetical protein